MVQSDVRQQSSVFLEKLFRCRQAASQIFQNNPSCSITQFSDFIVAAKPFQTRGFEPFVRMLARYQRLLLNEQLLCRGGIAVNKHFSNGSFTFSAGLIDAYHVENTSARFPRVVISPELLSLIYPKPLRPSSLLVEEDDGLFFVDYLGITRNTGRRTLERSIRSTVQDLLMSAIPSVREKGMWLASYSDATLGTAHKTPRFQGKQIRA